MPDVFWTKIKIVTSQGILDGDFPNTCGTEQDGIGRIADVLLYRWWQGVEIDEGGEQDMGVQQELEPRHVYSPDSNMRWMAS